jgi:hypothetical protein
LQTVIATNNAYDTILLVDDNDRVVSRWQADEQTVADYVQSGADADNWESGEWPQGFAPHEADSDEDAEKLRTIAEYGTEYGRNGEIDSKERIEFWHLAKFVLNSNAGDGINGTTYIRQSDAVTAARKMYGDAWEDECEIVGID